MKKRFTTALLAGAMAASMAIPAMADPLDAGDGAVPVSSGTEVWAGIIVEDELDAKIKVEVPTLFAFVVKGTIDANANGVGSGADGNIYLPDVKVKVTQPSTQTDGTAQTAIYNLETIGYASDGKLPFTNYSTKLDATGKRKGMDVTINGNIKNEGTDASRKYWTHTTSAKTDDTRTNFKNYNVSIDENVFDTVAGGGLQMAAGIELTGPDADLGGAVDSEANVDAGTGYAVVGETHYAKFDVSVGGQLEQYKQVEESAKIGTIVWTISSEAIVSDDVDTAPNKDYLSVGDVTP